MGWSGQARRLAIGQGDDVAPDARHPMDGSSARRHDQPASPHDMTTAGGASGAAGADELATFCALVDAHAAMLTRVAAALVGASDAEDAAQEAVVRAWRAWPALRDRSSARAWLISITVNVCRDWLRGRFGARRRLTESLTGVGDEPRPIAQLDADPGASDYAAALDLRHAITTLDDDLRGIVALRYYAGMDSTTIGAALGMPAATVRTKLRRALSQLRERLEGAPAPDPNPVSDPASDTEGRR